MIRHIERQQKVFSLPFLIQSKNGLWVSSYSKMLLENHQHHLLIRGFLQQKSIFCIKDQKIKQLNYKKLNRETQIKLIQSHHQKEQESDQRYRGFDLQMLVGYLANESQLLQRRSQKNMATKKISIQLVSENQSNKSDWNFKLKPVYKISSQAGISQDFPLTSQENRKQVFQSTLSNSNQKQLNL